MLPRTGVFTGFCHLGERTRERLRLLAGGGPAVFPMRPPGAAPVVG